MRIENFYVDHEGRTYRVCFMNGRPRFVVQKLHGYEAQPLKFEGRLARKLVAQVESYRAPV